MIYDLDKRALGYLEPLIILLYSAYGCTVVFLEIITFTRRPRDIFSGKKWTDGVFEKVALNLESTFFTIDAETDCPTLVSQASGTVLELGPGTGNQLSRYDKSKVTKIYGVEPNVGLHARLRTNIKKAGLADIYEILPFGGEDTENLSRYGIEPKSLDTVLSVQVLCSVPDPEGTVRHLYPYLKNGGKFIVYEHVKSDDVLSALVQNLYNIIWPLAVGGCHLNRPTERYLKAACDWSRIDLQVPTKDESRNLFPRVRGILTK